MKLLFTLPIVVGLLGLVGCRSSERPKYNHQEEKSKIQEIAIKFDKAIEQGNADSLAILFDEKAHYATNNGYLLQ